jgi:hypothetical protein
MRSTEINWAWQTTADGDVYRILLVVFCYNSRGCVYIKSDSSQGTTFLWRSCMFYFQLSSFATRWEIHKRRHNHEERLKQPALITAFLNQWVATQVSQHSTTVQEVRYCVQWPMFPALSTVPVYLNAKFCRLAPCLIGRDKLKASGPVTDPVMTYKAQNTVTYNPRYTETPLGPPVGRRFYGAAARRFGKVPGRFHHIQCTCAHITRALITTDKRVKREMWNLSEDGLSFGLQRRDLPSETQDHAACNRHKCLHGNDQLVNAFR